MGWRVGGWVGGWVGGGGDRFEGEGWAGGLLVLVFGGGDVVVVIRLSLGTLWVNLLQVVKRTNTSLMPYQMASSAGP